MKKFNQHPHTKSLMACWKEGVAASLAGVLGNFSLPFALFLGASATQIGLLIALPHLIGAISQITAERLVQWSKSRLQLLKQFSFLQAVFILLMVFLIFIPHPFKILLLIILSIILSIFNNLIGTFWGSLTSEYVADEERGSYFGWRSRIVGFWGLIAFGVSGFLLSWAEKENAETLGFFVMIVFTAVAKFVSVYYYRQMEDLKIAPSQKQKKFTWKNFFEQFHDSYFVAFTLFVMAMTFSTQFAAPYFSVYMLENLKFKYDQYMFVHLAGAIAGLVSFPIWGGFADRIGNVRVLKITSLCIPLIPLLWIISRNVPSLILTEIFGGIVWAGFNLASMHYLFDSTRPEKRVQFLSYFNLLNGVCLSTGVFLGGFLVERLPAFFGLKIYTIFLISVGLRILTHFILSPHFKEVRKNTESISWQDLITESMKSSWNVGRNQFFKIVTRDEKKD